MGDVFLARDELLARDVAIKTLRPLGISGFSDEGFKARFLNEARAIASLAHPNIVGVFDLGFEGDTPFLVMEVVGGRSLRDRLQSGDRLGAEQARMLGIQMGRALDAAHARGIIHRDIKPGNILEAEPGLWKLADFGVAHVPDSSLTTTGEFIGSPMYAAPEGLLAGKFSSASDVYGLGATLYEALSGKPPYGDSPLAIVGAQARDGGLQPLARHCAGVPADLARVVESALSRDPKARPTAARLAAELASPSPPTLGMAPVRSAVLLRIAAGASRLAAWVVAQLSDRKRRLWAAGGVVALILFAVVVGRTGSNDRPPSTSFVSASLGEDEPGASQTQRSRDQRKRWEKAQEKLAEGKYEDAAKELRKLLQRDPNDAEARRLLEGMQGEREWEDD
jgi:serine/threonine-protein kinase